MRLSMPSRKNTKRGITINTALGEYETAKRHYAHIDNRTRGYVKNMILVPLKWTELSL